MKGNCIDIGTLQAFLDGELVHAETARVSSHIAGCDICALSLANAEEESAVVFATLDREFNALVPTQRLWSKINDSIAVEKEQTPFWKRAWTFVAIQLANPSIAVAASVLVVFGIFTAVWSTRTSVTNSPSAEVARRDQLPTNVTPVVAPSPEIETGANTSPAEIPFLAGSNPQSNARTLATNVVSTKDVRPNIREQKPNTSNGYMPGEESYVKTIANLSREVNPQKDGVMRPSERISYERDMAVVDDAIDKMRKEVRKNPKNESAKQVLYTSYQNKIDLLNSVSQKEELMASLK